MGSSVKKMVTALGLDKIISKTVSALNNSLDGAIKRVDTLSNFPRVMNNLGIATEDATEAINELSDGLIGLPTTLNDGVSAVQRFTSQNNDVKKSTKMFLALNNAILAGGASTEVQASAMEQLSQAYAKGKPDAMEWRSILTAMPAQLKQVAKAMGYTSTAVGGDLYTAIQQGKISMDDLMDTIMRLNDEGIGEFASFAKQAKASTGGIATSITNVKTAITRGLANSIEALNKSLKNANLPTVSEVIQNFGSAISKAFNKVNEIVGKIKWDRITPIIKDLVNYIKNLKDVAFGFIKTVLKSIDWNTVLNIAPTILKIVIAFKTVNPLIKTGQSLINGLGNAIQFFSNKANLTIAVITAVATALAFLATNQSEEQRELNEFNKRVKEATKEMKDFNKTVDENMKKSVAQIDYTKTLSDELKTLVDENGKVKEGYKERVKFILNQLNDALGTEYKLNGNIIENYKDLQKEIGKTIEKKRAEIILSSEEEKYKKAIETRTKAYEELNSLLEKTGMRYDELKKKMDSIRNQTGLEGFISTDDLLLNLDFDFNDEDIKWLANYGEAFQNLEEQIKTSTQNMTQYEEDYGRFTRGEFEEIGSSIITTTKDWTKETEKELSNNISIQEKKLKANLDMYIKTGNARYKNEVNNNLKTLNELRTNLQNRTGTISKMSSIEVEAWIRLAQKDRNAFNNEISKTTGDTKEQLKAIGRAIDEKGYIPENKIQEVANEMASTFTKLKDNSYTWGYHLIGNLTQGINNHRNQLFGTVLGIAERITSIIGHSHPKAGPMKDDPKWMPDFVEVLNKSLEASTPKLYKTINGMASQMKEQLSLGVNMSPTLNNVSSYNPSINVKVYNNMETDFMGNLVSNIKTFSNGSKNDYNYGTGR